MYDVGSGLDGLCLFGEAAERALDEDEDDGLFLLTFAGVGTGVNEARAKLSVVLMVDSKFFLMSFLTRLRTCVFPAMAWH